MKNLLDAIDYDLFSNPDVCIYEQRIKLSRMRDNWKEVGFGNAKFMRNDSTKMIRFIMQQENFDKTLASFLITESPSCVDIKQMENSENSFLWICHDFS